MTFTSLRPIIYTKDFEETIAFYTEILGFNLDERNDDWRWASLSKDDIGIMLAIPNAHTPFDKPQFTGSFYINVGDVEKAWAALKDKAPICYGIETFDWGMREFAIYDNNGYVLQFGQEMA